MDLAESTTGAPPGGSRRERRRQLPARSKSTDGGPGSSLGRSQTRGAPRRTKSGDGQMLKRSNTTDGGLRSKPRKKKKGIRLAITVTKRERSDEDAEAEAEEENGGENENENLRIYNLQTVVTGKYSKKSCWPDVNAFWEDREVDKDVMCDLLEQYGVDFYPERKDAENVRPKRCYLADEKLRGFTCYKDYGWDPVEIKLQARGHPEPIEILESTTRQIKLEDIPYTPGVTNIDHVLIEQGDKSVTSTLIKSKLGGHPLALAMMQSETQIVVDFRGLESIVGVLGNEDDSMIRDTNEDGDYIWRDIKTLRTLLYDKPVPVKEGKGSQRILEVMALETHLKCRVYYRAWFEGDVVSDHGIGLMLGERWWAHPLKDIMSGFNVNNSALIWEDIDLLFYSEVGYKMDNEYWDWENHGGKWVKVKKNREL